jgi:O-antigen ligase
LLALAIYLFEGLSKLYFIGVLVFFMLRIIGSKRQDRFFNVLVACAYIVGADVFLRMTNGNFLYEISKYLLIFFAVIGMLFEGFKIKAMPYLVYILLLVPGIFIAGATASYTTSLRTAIAFNLSGPVSLGIVALYCYDKTIAFKRLKQVLLAVALPLITTAFYLFLYTPNIRDVVTGTYSNFATSGGFGPNQVSTVLGLGMFVLVTRFFLDSNSTVLKGVNLALLGIVAYRGLVTFSRGGMLTGFIIIVAFMGLYYLSSVRANRAKVLRHVYVLVGAFVLIWLYSSIQTMGMIDKRYANQDALGREKEDLTTGRTDLISFELNEFQEHPFFGIGVGKVKELRYQVEGEKAASHNEISRILAEHGLFGAAAFMILFLTPLIYRSKHRRNIFFYSFFLFWLLTVNHSAMRIAAPSFIYALSLLNVNFKRVETPPLHRQQA